MTMHHQAHLRAHALLAFAATALIVMAFATGAPAQSGKPDRESDPSLQETAAVVEVARTPFQQYRFTTTCPVNENCTVDFGTVPPASRLEITNVSCYIEVVAPPTDFPYLRVAQLLVIRSNGSIATASTMLLEEQHANFPPSSSTRGFAANHSVAVFANAGQHFQAYADPLGPTDRVGFMACHISGTLVRLG
jgi:hypothetical protein